MNPLQHYHLQDLQLQTDPVGSITRKIAAECIAADNEAIVQAVIECAKAEGINDMYLLDRRFVLDALREKLDRERGLARNCKTCSYKAELTRLQELPNCNDCLRNTPNLGCSFCPNVGQDVRINCPHWLPRKEGATDGTE